MGILRKHGPLNPDRREVGKITEPYIRGMVTKARAEAQRSSDGLAQVEIGGQKYTVEDTDKIEQVVAQVKKNLGI